MRYSFQSYIVEVFNNPYEMQNTSYPGGEGYLFTPKSGDPMAISLNNIEEYDGTKSVSVSFQDALTGKHTMFNTNNKDEFRIFATVADALKKHLIKYPRITKISFLADKDEASRVKLYDTLSKRLANILGWEYEKQSLTNSILYDIAEKD